MIIDFEEKPPIPKGSLVSTGMYYFFADTLPMIQQYLELGYNPDAPGYYVQWLYKKIKLYGYIVEGIWFDIGDIDSYKEANDYFLKD
jgi:glucose-1-phosphate thymidylyltransferase